jgi:hypothetical protein
MWDGRSWNEAAHLVGGRILLDARRLSGTDRVLSSHSDREFDSCCCADAYRIGNASCFSSARAYGNPDVDHDTYVLSNS